MVEKLTLEKIEEAVEKLESLEEKKKYLKKVLSEIEDDEELEAEVEKLLNQLKDKDTLETKFTTPIPAPELPEEPVKSEIKDIVIAPSTPEVLEEKSASIETYARPESNLYGTRTEYMAKSSQEAVHNTVDKYLRGENIKPEEFASSYELQKQATVQAYERLGGEVNFYTLQEQVKYEANKAAHPELTWERDQEGWIKYKPIKGINPTVEEEE